MVDVARRSRRGPLPLADGSRRTHVVSVRLNPDELALLDRRRLPLRMQRGEYLRAAGFDRLPPSIPEMNREQWVELSRLSANLNQIAHHLNSGGAPSGIEDDVRRCSRLLADVRNALIGVKDEG